MDKTPITYRGAVYPWHCDHIGHMNVMHYVGKFDEATWNFFAIFDLTGRFLKENSRGMAAVEQNIIYKRELLPGETLFIQTTLLEIRDKVIKFRHEMFNNETKELAASCELTGVHMDTKARKSTAFPSWFIEKAREFL